MTPTVLFFGGNGHAAARLAPVRAVLGRFSRLGAAPLFDLVDVPYPGFEGRPRAADAEGFVAAVTAAAAESTRARSLAYATGIGALFAVTLRTRGALAGVPLVLQGPVLWGLERRWMPRLARLGLAPLIPRLLGTRAFQRRFVRRHFVAPLAADRQHAFFDGYARCAATADLFRWCGPRWLRQLERGARERPLALEDVQVWWGAHDHVVGPPEMRWTEDALGGRWPERTFPGWGHYPMIDDAEGWVAAVAAATAGPSTPVMIGR